MCCRQSWPSPGVGGRYSAKQLPKEVVELRCPKALPSVSSQHSWRRDVPLCVPIPFLHPNVCITRRRVLHRPEVT